MTKPLSLRDNFAAARRAGTPLMHVSSFDPEACMAAAAQALNGKADETPLVQWDVINGWRHRNKAGEQAVEAALGGESPLATQNPVVMLEMAVNLPERTILFVLNAQHQIIGPPVNQHFVQALWNLRDQYKHNKRAVVLISPGMALPPELRNDVLALDEHLPDETKIREIVGEMAEAAGIPVPEETMVQAVDALRGIPAFPAEQAAAMSFTKAGLDIERLWERKRQLINDTPGLGVWRGGQKFEDLGGLGEIKARLARIIGGRKPPKVVVWVDEIEKSMGGSDSDSSGTSQDQLGVLLSEMQDQEYDGMMLVGVPGAAKSAFAKSIANEAGVLTVRLDLGELKGQFVGQSEERIRAAMKIIEAVGGKGGAFFVATSNDIRAVKPELKRRFRKGIWFFDLPSREERQVIWGIFKAKYEIGILQDSVPITFDEGWTGAEIETCCATAWEEGITLTEASASIIPVSVSGREQVERLRLEAHGRYNATDHPGAYVSSDPQVRGEARVAGVGPARKIEVSD